jgi:Icc-related predicted phosphoesterase
LVKGGNSLIVIGLGGSNPTPFCTPNELSEEAMARLLDEAWRRAGAFAASGAGLPTLLLTHAPPHGTRLDRLKNGCHVGSKAVRTFIEKYQPSLCVCGHIHEAKGEDRLGATALFNCGAFAQGGWVEIDVEAANIRAKLF